MYDFQERMADGRAAAKRNRERNGTSPYECYANERQRFAGMSDDDWHARCADDEAYVAGTVDAMPAVPQPATEKVKRTMTKQPKRTTGNQQLSPLSGGRSMTEKTYVRLLNQLGHSAYSGGPALGISPRMSMRYAAGTHPIPDTIAKLLRALVELGRTDV